MIYVDGNEFRTVSEAVSYLECPLHRPSFSRFAAWCAFNNMECTRDGDYRQDHEAPQDAVDGKEDAIKALEDALKDAQDQQDQGQGQGQGQGDDQQGGQGEGGEGGEDGDGEGGKGGKDDPFVKHSELAVVVEGIGQGVQNMAETLRQEIASNAGDNEVIKEVKQEIEEIKKGSVRRIEVDVNMIDLNKKAKKITGQHYAFGKLLAAVMADIPAFMVGPAGSFKTTAAESVAKELKLEFYPQSVGAQTTQAHLLGFIDANGNYNDTAFRKAYENGGVFLLDEIDAGNPNTLTVLNAALSNGYMSFPDGIIKKHADFRCVAAANTFGSGSDRQYVGRNQLDAATLDRFVSIVWDYDEVMESKIATNPEWTKTVQGFRAAVKETQLRHVVSPRASINGGKLIEAGVALNEVKEMLIYRGLSAGDRKKLDEQFNKIVKTKRKVAQ